MYAHPTTSLSRKLHLCPHDPPSQALVGLTTATPTHIPTSWSPHGCNPRALFLGEPASSTRGTLRLPVIAGVLCNAGRAWQLPGGIRHLHRPHGYAAELTRLDQQQKCTRTHTRTGNARCASSSTSSSSRNGKPAPTLEQLVRAALMNESAPTLGMSSGSGTYGSDCDTGWAVAESSSPAWGETHEVRADQEANMAIQLQVSRTCEWSDVLNR